MITRGWAIALALALAACATPRAPSPSRDGPPEKPPADLAAVPDAVPQQEPLSAHGNPDTYEVHGRRYTVLDSAHGFVQEGLASWYGRKFHGRLTSSGEPYDMYAMTAAHKRLPLPSYVRVTNLENDREIIVRVNDRGPFHPDRVIDLSYTAAVQLDMVGHGTARALTTQPQNVRGRRRTRRCTYRPVLMRMQPMRARWPNGWSISAFGAYSCARPMTVATCFACASALTAIPRPWRLIAVASRSAVSTSAPFVTEPAIAAQNPRACAPTSTSPCDDRVAPRQLSALALNFAAPRRCEVTRHSTSSTTLSQCVA